MASCLTQAAHIAVVGDQVGCDHIPVGHIVRQRSPESRTHNNSPSRATATAYRLPRENTMNFIDEWLRYLTGGEDAEPSTATTLYEMMVP